MQAYQFKTSIPKSGIIAIPNKIKREVLLKEVEVIIKEKNKTDLIDILKGSFTGSLSTSTEFSKRKKEEKKLEKGLEMFGGFRNGFGARSNYRGKFC